MEKEKQLIYKINNEDYLLVKRDYPEYMDKQDELIEIGVIEQAQDYISGGALGTDVWIISFLVPCKNLDKYMKIIQ